MDWTKAIITSAIAIFLAVSIADAFPSGDDDTGRLQASMTGMDKGERIAAWAERFIGTPYDPDPKGLYVTTRRIISDEKADCMYHTFRSVELALSNTPAEAAQLALDLRFRTKGVLGPAGLVQNYEERYEYGMDMVRGGRWGGNITAGLGKSSRIKGERGLEYVDILPRDGIPKALDRMRSGDIVYFIKDPKKRVVGEIVGHLGIVKVEGEDVYLIHASGRKRGAGQVVKVPFAGYVAGMPFVGIVVTRFE